jgi:hypothetical protein
MSGEYYPLLLDPDETFVGFADSIPTVKKV